MFEKCKTCKPPIRHPGCHAKCEDYIHDKEIVDKEREEIFKKKEKYRLIQNYKKEGAEKALKKRLNNRRRK